MPGPRPAPVLPPEASPVTMTGYHVEGTITDQVAELSYRIVFRNPTDRRLEGVLMVPLPADASLSGFSMVIGGKETKGELLEASQASSIYQSIVSRAIDPGLLELIGERMFRAKVFPIEPRGEIVATLKMTQTLAKSGGLVTLSVRQSVRSRRSTNAWAAYGQSSVLVSCALLVSWRNSMRPWPLSVSMALSSSCGSAASKAASVSRRSVG